MDRTVAVAELQKMARGLAPDMAGCARLLERVAGHEDAEALRACLTERGVAALLDEAAR